MTKTSLLDLLHSFVRKIRAIKIMWNILFEGHFEFNSSHYQSAYSNRRSIFKWFYL